MLDLKNRVQLIGNLGKDPEVVTLDNGNKVAKFSLATHQAYKDSAGNKVEDTQWHNIVAWGNLATRAEKYLAKGKGIAAEGRLVHKSYDDKNGNKKYVTEVVLNDFLMLSQK